MRRDRRQVGNCRPARRPRRCAGARGKAEDDRQLGSYDEVVADYLARYAANAKYEMHWFGERQPLADAIIHACESRIESGRDGRLIRHPHQCFIPASALLEAAVRLSERKGEIAAIRDFRRLHDLVEVTIGPIAGIGELTIYDVAHRIGAHTGAALTEVYVHRGARKGARALGFHGRKTIAMYELPGALQRLTAAQAEDALCIYHNDLARLRRLDGVYRAQAK
jgi:hypothetical protein